MTDRPEGSLGVSAGQAAGRPVVSSARLETFSDGVFAIAITLLVLDLTISAAGGKHLLRALIDLWPSYLAYLTSFSIIGLVWMGHHVIASLTPGSGATSAQSTGCCRTT